MVAYQCVSEASVDDTVKNDNLDGKRKPRDRWVMMIAFGLVLAPIVGLMLFLMLRNVRGGDVSEWMFLLSVIWFLGAEQILSKYAKRTPNSAKLPRAFHEKRRKRWM